LFGFVAGKQLESEIGEHYVVNGEKKGRRWESLLNLTRLVRF